MQVVLPLLTAPSQIMPSNPLYFESGCHHERAVSCFSEKGVKLSLLKSVTLQRRCTFFNCGIKGSFAWVWRLAHFFKPFKSFQSVKKFDFHVAAFFAFDFRNIEKIKLFNILLGNLIKKKQLHGIAYTAESKTKVTCRNVAFATFPLLVDFFNFSAYVFTLQKTESTFFGKKISWFCCSLSSVARKTVISAKEFFFTTDFFDF